MTTAIRCGLPVTRFDVHPGLISGRSRLENAIARRRHGTDDSKQYVANDGANGSQLPERGAHDGTDDAGMRGGGMDQDQDRGYGNNQYQSDRSPRRSKV